MKIKTLFVSLLLIVMAAMYYGCTQAPKTETVPATIGADGIDRTVLPIKEPIRPTYKELDVRNATPPARFEVKAPAKAPNIVIILIDDMGFGVSESFGGPISMPTLDKLAQNGSPCKNHYPVFGQA